MTVVYLLYTGLQFELRLLYQSILLSVVSKQLLTLEQQIESICKRQHFIYVGILLL